MTPPFSLRTTSRYERLARHLLRSHPEFRALQERAFEIFTRDPHNRTGAQNIRKLAPYLPAKANGACRLGASDFGTTSTAPRW